MLGATVALGLTEQEHRHGALTSLCCVSCSSGVMFMIIIIGTINIIIITMCLNQQFLLGPIFAVSHRLYNISKVFFF